MRVVERDFAASGTSRACDGLILFSDKASPAELALAQASADLWAELAETLEADFEYARAGTLVLYETEEGLAAGRRKVADLQPAGVRAEIVDAAGLRGLEPNLAHDLAGAIYYLDEAQVDARAATLAMLDAAQRLGATLQAGTEVTGVRLGAAGRVAAVTTKQGEIPAAAVVCAAGVWSNEIARSAGVELPVRPRKGHILVTSRAPGLIAHPMLEGSYAASVQSAAEGVQVALVAEMTAGGTVLLGSSREFVGFDRSVLAGRRAGHRCPCDYASCPGWRRPASSAATPGCGRGARITCRWSVRWRASGVLPGDRPRGRRDRAGAGDRSAHRRLDRRRQGAGAGGGCPTGQICGLLIHRALWA